MRLALDEMTSSDDARSEVDPGVSASRTNPVGTKFSSTNFGVGSIDSCISTLGVGSSDTTIDPGSYSAVHLRAGSSDISSGDARLRVVVSDANLGVGSSDTTPGVGPGDACITTTKGRLQRRRPCGCNQTQPWGSDTTSEAALDSSSGNRLNYPEPSPDGIQAPEDNDVDFWDDTYTNRQRAERYVFRRITRNSDASSDGTGIRPHLPHYDKKRTTTPQGLLVRRHQPSEKVTSCTMTTLTLQHQAPTNSHRDMGKPSPSGFPFHDTLGALRQTVHTSTHHRRGQASVCH